MYLRWRLCVEDPSLPTHWWYTRLIECYFVRCGGTRLVRRPTTVRSYFIIRWRLILHGVFHLFGDQFFIFGAASLRSAVLEFDIRFWLIIGSICPFAWPPSSLVVQRCFSCGYRDIVISFNPRHLEWRVVGSAHGGFKICHRRNHVGKERVGQFIFHIVGRCRKTLHDRNTS